MDQMLEFQAKIVLVIYIIHIYIYCIYTVCMYVCIQMCLQIPMFLIVAFLPTWRKNLHDSTGSQEGHKSVFAMGCARSAKGRSRDVKPWYLATDRHDWCCWVGDG